MAVAERRYSGCKKKKMP